MGHLYYVTLGNGTSLLETGPFLNLMGGGHWTSTDSNADHPNAWRFSFSEGLQNTATKLGYLGAWAVHDGDVMAAVPEPESYMLMLAGLVLCAARFSAYRPANAEVIS
jgi:hypothetical protein